MLKILRRQSDLLGNTGWNRRLKLIRDMCSDLGRSLGKYDEVLQVQKYPAELDTPPQIVDNETAFDLHYMLPPTVSTCIHTCSRPQHSL